MNTYQLKHQAKLLQARAKEMLKLAKEVESMPDPIGPVIVDVVAMLARHGLCVINRAALKDVSEILENMQTDGGKPWPAGMYASVAAVHESLDRGLT